jgi:NADPH2:quinone reductase
MKAIGIRSLGGPEVLEVLELPVPEAGPGEVRIRVHAAAVNAADTAIRTGYFLAEGERPVLPQVPGMEAAGVIDQVGDASSGWKTGDRVMAFVLPHGTHGAYAEKITVPSSAVAAIPAGTDFAQAATLPMNGLTALMTLDMFGLTAGRTLAVTGAAGVVGGYITQMAKAEGLRVIGDASEADAEVVRSLGADMVVPRGREVAGSIRRLVPDGVDALADCSAQNEQVAAAVRDGGAMASLRHWTGDPGRGITLHQVMVSAFPETRAGLARISRQVEAGTLTPRVARILPMEDASAAHRALEAGGVRGKLVLAIG